MQIVDRGYWDDLIIDRLSGNLSKTDGELLDNWLDESEENRLYFSQMKDLWDSSGIVNEGFSFDYERAYELFRTRTASPAFKSQGKKRPLWKKAVSVAAVLLPFIFLGYYTALYFRSQQKEIPVSLISEITCPNGSRTQLRLADGSLVWLNSGSTLFYSDDFGKSNRYLKLVGEAYLEVARNEQLPLIVEAGEMKVKVLGTKFNVSAYGDSEEIRVFLLNGSVSLSGEGGEPLVLQPMEKAIYNIGSGQLEVFEEKSGSALSWMQNRLIFKGETLAQIVRTLQRCYNVKINIHNELLKERRFAGDFKTNDPIDKVFKIMASSNKFHYMIKGDTIDIY
ncbi:FecR family protein [Parabacteroides timonensis]|uniref:FecR family protein n=1 Tax=Parabacteroides timonensis TaxID=1871013 RepID=UPI000A89121D|nr:FecR domain-containing protein [Parabacteroides timonensis]